MAIKNKKGNTSSLAKRYKQSHESSDGGSSNGSKIINWRSADSDVKFFQAAIGKNAINIIPYEIKSKNHPLVRSGSMEIGDLDYVLDIWTHRFVGPSETNVLCLKRTYGKACPICEESQKLFKAGKEDEAKSLKASRRVIYNIEDVKKAPGKLQVFEASHYLFEQELIDEARSEEDGEETFVQFADIEDGAIVKFRANKSTKGGFDFTEYKSFSFEEREEAIDSDLLDAAISFDEFLIVPTYEQVQAILYGVDEDGDEDGDDEDAPKSSKKNSKKPALKDEDGDEDSDDEAPPARPPKKPTKPATKDEDEDEDGDEESPKPSKKSKSSGGKSKCPHGYAYGEDVDEYDECEDCELWSKCADSSEGR